jgi:hypothetical protein
MQKYLIRDEAMASERPCMAVYSGNSGSILFEGVIVGAVAEWRLLLVQHNGDARWTGVLTWQWLSLPPGGRDEDEFEIELQDGSATPSYNLSGRTTFTGIDLDKHTLEFRGHGDLTGAPDPGPDQSEIAIT